MTFFLILLLTTSELSNSIAPWCVYVFSHCEPTYIDIVESLAALIPQIICNVLILPLNFYVIAIKKGNISSFNQPYELYFPRQLNYSLEISYNLKQWLFKWDNILLIHFTEKEAVKGFKGQKGLTPKMKPPISNYKIK